VTASPEDLMTVALARDLRPEDRTIQSGANLPLARAAVILARQRLPNSRVTIDLAVENLAGERELPSLPPYSFDLRTASRGEAFMDQGTIFDDVARPEAFFLGGLEVDQRGNLNLLGKRRGDGSWAFRGPGALALASMSTFCKGYYIVMQRHDRRSFVRRVALISALGDRTERKAAALPGGGPRLVVSPLGVFDFDDAGDMRVRSVHPGVDRESLAAATGFELPNLDSAPTTEPPSVEEAELLRSIRDESTDAPSHREGS
jgi:glutaconate CoA-transferase, subunit B